MPCLLRDTTSNIVRRKIAGGNIMSRRIYYELDEEDRLYVGELVSSIDTRNVNVSRTTMEECCARVLRKTKGRKEDRIPSVIELECIEEIRKSDDRSNDIDRREKACRPLYVFKGAVTTSLLKQGRGSIDSEIESLTWSDEEDRKGVRRQIRWDDIYRLSAIYSVWKANNGRDRDVFVKIEPWQVFECMHPSLKYYPESRIETFVGELNDTVERFRQLSGTYTDKKTGQSWNVDGDFFLRFEDGYTCFEGVERNEARLSMSTYQHLCDYKQSRLVYIPKRCLSSESEEDDNALSYLVYRHQTVEKDCRGSMRPSLLFSTLWENLCVPDEGDWSTTNTASTVRRLVEHLKPMFRGRNVKSDRITWKKENQE